MGHSYRCAALVLTAVAAIAAGARAQGEAGTRVLLTSGSIDGVLSNGIAAYEGIPYAAPPIGPLRWAPPSPARPWPGLVHANAFGSACMQAGDGHLVNSPGLLQSEDCLTLNVWTPIPRSLSAPVMVWLHGGGNVDGTAADHYYDGSSFARNGEVLVSMNYRLGVFGFFAPPGTASSVNFGLLDQIAALRWVRANISAFGGDANNVTVFGESAGALDALLLMDSPPARGLFSRVIAESAGGIWSRLPSLADARRASRNALQKIGANAHASLADLRAMPAGWLAQIDEGALVGPVVDGSSIVSRLGTDGAVPVPLMIGTDGDDGSISGDAAPATFFPAIPRADLESLRQRYATLGISSSGFAQALFGDGFFAAPSRWFAQSQRSAAPVYRYRFDYVASFLRSRRAGATHGSEIPYVFDSFRSPFISSEDRRIVDAVHACWAAFARTGAPTCDGLPAWSPDAGDGREMIIDASPAMRDPGDGEIYDVLRRDIGP